MQHMYSICSGSNWKNSANILLLATSLGPRQRSDVGVMRALLFIAFAVFLAGCASRSQREVERASAFDPVSLSLERAYNDYVRRSILADGTEAGIISCRDGSSSRYWFRSHHLTHDDGGTLFRFSDGSQVFMSGYFCCEVQFPEQQFASLAELRAFIREHGGVSP